MPLGNAIVGRDFDADRDGPGCDCIDNDSDEAAAIADLLICFHVAWLDHA